MFLVGVEFRKDLFQSRIRSAASVSILGMTVPFLLGCGIALWLLQTPGMFSEKATKFDAALFLGASMAITAFPMLARIIYERGLSGTSLGTLVLAAGSIDDAAAWCVLAIVLASFGGGALVAVKAIVGGIAYGVLVLTVGRRLLARIGETVERDGKLTPGVLAVIMMILCLCCWTTDAIGIHAVFGGFLLGVAMPRGRLTRELQAQLEPFTVVFLLPMFFTFSGLNTRLDTVNSPQLLLIALVVLLAACLGKGGACWAAARLSGEDNRTALAVGTLMNARGMMELILLNIGLQKGIIEPALFSIMVLMAVVTTLMASPVFEWVYGRHARASGELKSLTAERH
jgi:Kef-type K+ transport system membrane component KefB